MKTMNFAWRTLHISALVLVCWAGPTLWAEISIGIDPTNKTAWTENAGWANFTQAGGGVMVHFDGSAGFLTGYAWGENIGWISFGAYDGGPYDNTTAHNWGVNMAANGKPSGYAWSENTGWINFGHTHCDASVDPTNGELSGHAWGENIGWVKFKGSSPDYGTRTFAFDEQPQGTPNWWLAHHGVGEGYDVGDGFAAWQKYVMDTNPHIAGDYLRITAISKTSAGTQVTFAPASTRRYYTLSRREDLTADEWSNVAGEIAVQYGANGEKTMQDTEAMARALYRVKVQVEP